MNVGEDDDAEQEKFERMVDELGKWLKQRCTPVQAVSVLGAVASEFIWETSSTNKIAQREANDFCKRVCYHVQRLNEAGWDTTNTRLQ